MKTHCNIIRDLLPLVIDDVCSAESKKMVDEHIKSCPSCRLTLEQMQSDFEIIPVNNGETDIARAASRAWKRTKGKSLLKGIGICILALCLIYGMFIFPYTKLGMELTVSIFEEQLTATALNAIENGQEKEIFSYKIRPIIESNCVYFEYQGPAYTGFFYSMDGVPIGFQGVDMQFEKLGKGWIWKEENGDNWMYVEEISENWYWYEMYF